ncbi:phage tail sheath subtilisin-like domain-containing protein [Candidatus Cyanaurora vandensis]|uniref:phage tail sheath family protein n=1 Tax=Candidatus Cyanaurora vandensis TaxID=2714958 RepID=UPI00257DCF96|nr:phage tail sheath subtilisin-like domain-containing protein [Candidatus Cyanaurora vandensis]
MPVTPTYPGIYIEELPSNARTITAAPTSVAVFSGYSHPYRTRNFDTAVEIFNFTDYEREFGGLYDSGLIEINLAHAVNQFFLNGGSVAYVVGLEPKYYNSSGAAVGGGTIPRPETNIGDIQFQGLEPTDQTTMTVTVNNLSATSDTADILIAYGSRVEVFRGVNLNATSPDYIEKRLGTDSDPTAARSALVRVRPTPPAIAYSGVFTAALQQSLPMATLPVGFAGTFSATDFTQVFQADSSLDKVRIFNLLVLPGVVANEILSAALAFCERKQAFFIMDPAPQAGADSSNPLVPPINDFVDALPKSPNGALYFPYLRTTNPLNGRVLELPPSGYVAGIYARTDLNRGVWKAPAGLETTLLNTIGVVDRGRMTDPRQGVLNPRGVNCLRSFPGVGTVVFGARTLVTENPAFQQYRYVPVRRLTLFIEQTLYRNLGWAVFEPNDEPLWLALRTTVDNFMLSLFSQGAFQGGTPSLAFQVKCDASTTTQTDIDNGVVNLIVAFRPLKPAEFIVIKIAQLAGQVQS